MKISLKKIVSLVLKGLIPIVLYGCGQSIGYKDVGSEIRYYSTTTPDWLPSASGGKRYSIIKEYVNRSKFETFETYAKDDKTVWFYTIPITGADAESFVGLEGNYAKDKFRVYLNGMPLQDVNSEFFEVIESNQNNELFKFIYTRTDKDIYCMGSPLHVSSIHNFELIPEFLFWAKDGVNYFFRSRKIVIGNYDAIEIFGDQWYKDNLFVYHTERGAIIIDKGLNSDIPSLDINTVQKTEVGGYFRDKFGYISGYSKKRVSIEDYEYQKIEL
tara:strand:+ start:9691 stop:10506 length:816 start_codon:yes stop_codon:yes gene_type:complete